MDAARFLVVAIDENGQGQPCYCADEVAVHREVRTAYPPHTRGPLGPLLDEVEQLTMFETLLRDGVIREDGEASMWLFRLASGNNLVTSEPSLAGKGSALSEACSLLSYAVGTIMGMREKAPYTDNSPIAKLVDDIVEFLRPWPGKLPAAPISPANAGSMGSKVIRAAEGEGAKEAALYDSAYVAGLGAGWSFGATDDHDGYQKAVASRSGRIAALRDSRSTLAPEGQPISRAEWMAQAKAYYLEAGDDEKTATECARYMCDQQDWLGDDIGDPRAEAQEDVQGRPRPISAPEGKGVAAQGLNDGFPTAAEALAYSKGYSEATNSNTYKRMFDAAVVSLAEISKALDIPDEDAACADGNSEILAAIEELQARAALAASTPSAQVPHDLGQRYSVEFDGFTGTVIGAYRRLDGEEGVVMQQDDCKVVHVYRRKWLKSAREKVNG